MGGEIKMHLKEMGCEDVNWIDLAWDRNKWQAPVNTVINLFVPQISSNLSAKLATISV
jgi:hypothetical protein